SPVAQALACTVLNHDQSARNGADVLEQQLVKAQRKAATCAGAGGDSTDYRRITRCSSARA
ncbi:hypothetical protein OAO87_03745, partial [bacterium]|nr:hypothetical protein [bacterium]